MIIYSSVTCLDFKLFFVVYAAKFIIMLIPNTVIRQEDAEIQEGLRNYSIYCGQCQAAPWWEAGETHISVPALPRPVILLTPGPWRPYFVPDSTGANGGGLSMDVLCPETQCFSLKDGISFNVLQFGSAWT